MFQLIKADPRGDQVGRITFVPFLADGRCVLVEDPGGPALPAGEVRDGEDYSLDAVLRVPLETAGFRYQRFHPFGLDRDHRDRHVHICTHRQDRSSVESPPSSGPISVLTPKTAPSAAGTGRAAAAG